MTTGPETGPRCSEEEATESSDVGLDSIPFILSFDVEEHNRIEAAVGLEVDSKLKGDYRERMTRMTEWILEKLADGNIRATFFIVGQIGNENPKLVRAIHDAGHEVASHGWDHRRIHVMTPATFREDVLRSTDTLEQVTGAADCRLSCANVQRREENRMGAGCPCGGGLALRLLHLPRTP